MSKLPNIIHRRELEPLLFKAGKIARYYEKAANCAVSVVGPNGDIGTNNFNSLCKQCRANNEEKKTCLLMHKEAVNAAGTHGGSYIYACPSKYVFWASPFYSGKRFAGAFLSGGVHSSEKNNDRVKALANMILICADQISEHSFNQKNIAALLPNQEETHEEFDLRKISQYNENNANLLDLERIILANLRRGDNVEAKNLLIKLLNVHYKEAGSNFHAFSLKAMELAVLLSRAACDPNDAKNNTVLEMNCRYLKKIENSTNFQEIVNILFSIMEQISGKIFSFHGVRHFAAIGKAERFIWKNYTKKISLKDIAKTAGLSAPYFSTIFKEEMGENLSSYLNRLRSEKAATLLITTNMPLSEISSSCGFEDQSWFSKIFKSYTSLTPGKYRAQGSIPGLSEKKGRVL